MDPVGYRNTYLSLMAGDSSVSAIFSTSSYTPTFPLPWNLNLNRVARAHAFDRGTNCPMLTIDSTGNG